MHLYNLFLSWCQHLRYRYAYEGALVWTNRQVILAGRITSSKRAANDNEAAK